MPNNRNPGRGKTATVTATAIHPPEFQTFFTLHECLSGQVLVHDLNGQKYWRILSTVFCSDRSFDSVARPVTTVSKQKGENTVKINYKTNSSATSQQLSSPLFRGINLGNTGCSC